MSKLKNKLLSLLLVLEYFLFIHTGVKKINYAPVQKIVPKQIIVRIF